jgi:hypothetical protein
MKWAYTRISSEDKEAFSKLDDSNHIFNFHDRVLEMYDITPEPEKGVLDNYGMEYMITSWVEGNTLRNHKGVPLDIVVHSNLETKEWCWEPFVEYVFRYNSFKRPGIVKYEFGYIDGKHGHLSILKQRENAPEQQLPGYILWSKVYLNHS